MDEVTIETRRMLNRVAREQMKERLMRDILADMTVCELEGWDRVEYLNELMELIDSFIEPRNTRKESHDH